MKKEDSMQKMALRLTKIEKQAQILFGLIDLYIASGASVSSKQLQEYKFLDISPATIRNYFSTLEKEGFLIQKHASSGKVPPDEAFK